MASPASSSPRSRRSSLGRAVVSTLAAVVWLCPFSAYALSAEVVGKRVSLPGETVEWQLVVDGAVGDVQVRWDPNDGSANDFVVGAFVHSQAYANVGHYGVNVLVTDGVGRTSAPFVHTVHRPLTPLRPSAASDIVYDERRERIYVVNTDNDTVSVLDPKLLTNVVEIPVLRGPEGLALAPDGRLWVVHRAEAAVGIVDLDAMGIVQRLELPRASQPIAIAMSPTGDAAYVTLMATGELLKLDPQSGAELGRLVIGPTPRGIAVSHDGSEILVTRFISPDSGGEIARVDARSLAVLSTMVLQPDATTMDTDQQGRGLPNYLFSVTISPDATTAWVTAKKDNLFRGQQRGGPDQLLNPDNTVRPLVSMLSLDAAAAVAQQHVDLDDRNLPTYVAFTPLGDRAFVSVTGSALVEERDAYTGGQGAVIRDMGFAPRGLVLTPDNRLFVNAALSRNVAVYDVGPIVLDGLKTAKKLADIALVGTEKLEAKVLRGKQIFIGDADDRMSDVGYISCASCHFDGGDDGRVWDLTQLGEGLRNTVSLLGRRGTGQGRLNWTGTNDEVQDSDHMIRSIFGGVGFIPNELLAPATGEPNQGKSEDLDALAAYVESLDKVNPSPARLPDGSSSPDALAGRALFDRLGCGFCHSGADRTDSARGRLHDVGTRHPTSGNRGGEQLAGFDTPTLRGIWETAPYLHDGSAPTLRSVLVDNNLDDSHGYVSSLTSTEVDQLVAYLLELDGTPEPGAAGSEVGPSPGIGGVGSGGAADSLAGHNGFNGSNGSCSVSGSRTGKNASFVLGALAVGLVLRRRGRLRAMSARRRVTAFVATSLSPRGVTQRLVVDYVRAT